MKLKLPNWGSLCNPNLLMNSDYRSGIINQKGITSLDKSDGSTELGIDGWILYGINIAVGSNYVTFANRTNTTHTVQQPLDIKGLKAGDKVTFYASCFNITGNVYIYMTGLDAQKKKLVNGDNEFTFTLTSALERFYIELAPNAVVSFNCKKLEIGEHFTGMSVWDEALELLKCQRKILLIPPNFNGYGAGDGGALYLRYDNIINMDKNPSIDVNGNTKIIILYGGESFVYDIVDHPIRVSKKDGLIILENFSQWNNYEITGYFDINQTFSSNPLIADSNEY
ncbi:MAG: hypothetical protein KHY19_16240 [Coprobacillus cateniformis]|nr:hypothetical protein [Coprobacillus cateniformis]